jgi:hypothetical protein
MLKADILCKIIIAGISIFLIYEIYNSTNIEQYIQLDDSTSLNDCLSACSADIRCLNVQYDKKICKVSRNNGEVSFGDFYVKKDSFLQPNMYADPNMKKYIIEPNFDPIPIDWSADVDGSFTTARNFNARYINYTDHRKKQNLELGIKEDKPK